MKISNLKRTKDGIVRVEISDGTSLRVSDGTVLRLGLCRDKELTDRQMMELEAAAEKDGFKMTALRMAANRLISRREAEKKLLEKGCDGEYAREISFWLEEIGAVNDSLLAENLVSHYGAKGFGKNGIRRELERRGIDREMCLQALEEIEPDEEAIDHLVAARLKGKTPDRKELNRVAAALMRRGHKWDDIRDALRRYEQDLEEDF